jgi:hypothetical protein
MAISSERRSVVRFQRRRGAAVPPEQRNDFIVARPHGLEACTCSGGDRRPL